MNTIPFDRDPRGRDPVLAQVARLPREVEPARDLWPGIEAGLSAQPAPRARHWPLALAAGLAVAAVSAVLTWSLLQRPATDRPELLAGEPAMPAFVPVSYGANTALGPEHLQARGQLLAEFHERLGTLTPASREAVLRNLAIIQQAVDEIDEALGEDPGSGLLNGLLFNLYQQELQLYSSVVAAGTAVDRRT